MEEFDRKIIGYINGRSGLTDVKKLFMYEGTHPTTLNKVRVLVKDHGVGVPGRYDVTAYRVDGSDEQYDKRSGDSLDEAMGRIHWEWL